MPCARKSNELRLVHLPVAGLLPGKRGWYRIDCEPRRLLAGAQLFLDLGMGFNRHHSVSLPRENETSFVRLPRPLRAVAAAAHKPATIIRFTPISPLRALGGWIADCVAIGVSAFLNPLRAATCRGVLRWSFRGLRLVPVEEARFPARSAYYLWRERYPEEHLIERSPSELIELRAEDFSADKLNKLLASDEIHWIGVIRNDAEVRPGAFVNLLQAAKRAEASIAYADSDRLDRPGGAIAPDFRTTFSPERLLSEDWLGPLLLFNAAAAKRVGGWRESAGDALHYDLCVRVLEKEGRSGFVHLPLVLASERSVRRKMSADTERVRLANLESQGLPVQAFGLRAAAAPSRIADRSTIIIPTRNRLDLLRPAVESVYKISEIPPREVLIVDNGSTDQELLVWLENASSQYSGLKVLRDDGRFNFSRLCNNAARVAKGDILVFLNNDIVISSPLWLELCGALSIRPGIGCVGPLLTYPDGRIQHAGMVTGPGGIATHVWSGQRPDASLMQVAPLVTRNVSGLTGACLVISKATFEGVGGFDEEHLRVAFNDLDLCLRLSELGLRHVFVPWCKVIHHESRSRGRDDYDAPDGRFRMEFDWMRNRWGAVLDNDPYFPRPLRIDKSRHSIFWSSNPMSGGIQ